MEHLSNQSCQPSRELRRSRHQFCLGRVRELGSQDLQGLGSLIRPEPCQRTDGLARSLVSKVQLPARRMTQFDRLLAKVRHTASPGGEVDRLDRHLRGEAQSVCRGSTARQNRLAPLRRALRLLVRSRGCAAQSVSAPGACRCRVRHGSTRRARPDATASDRPPRASRGARGPSPPRAPPPATSSRPS